MNQTYDTLRATREHLSDPANWRKQGGTGPKGERCVGLALEDFGDRDYKASYALIRALGFDQSEIEDPGVSLIFRWNDAPERIHADVLAALDKAIEAEQA